MNCRLQYPGFKLRIACFNPNLQDTQGCSQKNFPIHSIAQQREVCYAKINFNFHVVMLITERKTKNINETFLAHSRKLRATRVSTNIQTNKDD